jgi:glycosyltransferase involved in cell wall biosynthesis
MIAILDTHPVQYRAPVYRELERLRPGCFTVVYASDFSVKGYQDREFGIQLAWDVPLLDGYSSVIMGHGSPQGSAACRATVGYLRRNRPSAVLLTGIQGPFFWTAYVTALLLGIKICLRAETQDEAFRRSPLKAAARSLYYRLAYLPLYRIFYIGQLNRGHYLRHGVPARTLVRSPYATVDGTVRLTREDKRRVRAESRARLGISESEFVVSFFGKLIPKKNPDLLLEAMPGLDPELRRRTVLLYVGSGEMGDGLQAGGSVESAGGGARTIMAGFVNQSGLPACYLAADVVVLPSRQAGETWGLVVNEALQAGCAVVVTKAVGCAVEFADLARVSVIEIGDAAGLAAAISREADLPRDFDWAADVMRDYSIEAAARGIAEGLVPESGDLLTPT